MDDSPEIIRQQMEMTKSQLSEKLESLELQVAETVQSTSTAVNATVSAVQDTVETVTDAVQDAVHSVSNAFDVRRQFDKHPWLALGGAVVLGYVAAELLTGPPKQSPSSSKAPSQPNTIASGTGNADRKNEGATIEPTSTSATTATGNESGSKSSSLYQLKGIAIGALIGIMESVVSRAVPQVLDYLVSKQASVPTRRADEINAEQPFPKVVRESESEPMPRRKAT
jgi:hypothetical protein